MSRLLWSTGRNSRNVSQGGGTGCGTLATMTIDRSKKWWTGDSASDIETYLHEFTADGYPASDLVHAVCGECAGAVFNVRFDDDEGVAERTCTHCGSVVAMLDSADHLDPAELGDAACPCGNESFNVAIGFARQGDDVRWVYVGLRCTRDGVLGSYADWTIDYLPSGPLLNQV